MATWKPPKATTKRAAERSPIRRGLKYQQRLAYGRETEGSRTIPDQEGTEMLAPGRTVSIDRRQQNDPRSGGD